MSPTVGRIGPYRFFFYSNEGAEPPPVHVQRDRRLAKLWLSPVRFADTGRFGPHEISRIESIVRDNEPDLLEAWHEFFDR